MNRTLILAAAVAALPFAASAQQTALDQSASATASNLTVTGAYARSTNPSVGAAFMTIENAGAADCVLTAVAAPDVTDRAELHTHREENGVMSMVPIDSITIPAGGSHALERGADHVMLMDTSTALAEGDEVAMTLDFGDCGQVPLTVKVDNAAGMPASHGGTAGAPQAGNGHGN